jgi:putative ABC transport system permease protein
MARLPDAAPSAFILDIQPQQWPAVQALLRREGATNILSTPMLTARLKSMDGRSTRELSASAGSGDGAPREGRGEWALTREQRLTWQRELPSDNTLVAGALWSDPERAEVSVEEDFARDLGLSLGSRIELDVQGVPIELTVTSLRRVEWRTFRINFFLLVEPGVLEDAPHVVLAAARLPEGREGPAQDALVALAPNVTIIPIRDALARAAGLVTRLADGVSAVGAFSVIAGLAILAGAVAAGAARRGAELALLKTLGMTRREAMGMLVVEHAALGLVAGLIGATGGALIAGFILVRVMELPWHPEPAAIALAVLLTMALAAASGTLTCLRALARRPVEALRAE